MSPRDVAQAIAWAVREGEPFDAGDGEWLKGTAELPRAFDGGDAVRFSVMVDRPLSIGEEPEEFEVVVQVRRRTR